MMPPSLSRLVRAIPPAYTWYYPDNTKRHLVSFPFHRSRHQLRVMNGTMEREPGDLTTFRWWQPPEGLGPTWIDGTMLDLGTDEERFALVRDEKRWMYWDPFHPKHRQLYSPLNDTPALWRTFMDLAEGEAPYLEFAQRYGPLTNGLVLTNGENGVPYSRWLLAHRTLRSAWLVYEAARANRTRVLADWIRIDDKRARFIGQPVKGHAIKTGAGLASAGLDLNNHWKRHVENVSSTAERLRRLAMVWVWRTVNRSMKGPNYGSEESLAGDPVTAFLDLDDTVRQAVVRFQPSTLLAAMWLQFAKSIEGNLAYRQCKHTGCRAWFLLSPEGAGKRRQAQFCSNRCRLREWRKEKQHAKTRTRRR